MIYVKGYRKKGKNLKEGKERNLQVISLEKNRKIKRQIEWLENDIRKKKQRRKERMRKREKEKNTSVQSSKKQKN